jgi:hypothetical protein
VDNNTDSPIYSLTGSRFLRRQRHVSCSSERVTPSPSWRSPPGPFTSSMWGRQSRLHAGGVHCPDEAGRQQGGDTGQRVSNMHMGSSFSNPCFFIPSSPEAHDYWLVPCTKHLTGLVMTSSQNPQTPALNRHHIHSEALRSMRLSARSERPSTAQTLIGVFL